MKWGIIVFFGILFICEIKANIDPSCIQKGKDGSCEFYQCFEKRRQCGPSGYLLGYAYKYCNIHKSYYNKFTKAGKKWLDCVAPCLTRSLIEKYKESVTAGKQCEQLKTYAFKTKDTCYTNCGFCSIYDSSKLVLNSIYKPTDLISTNAFKHLSTLAATCSVNKKP